MAGWPGLSGGAHLVLRQPQGIVQVLAVPRTRGCTDDAQFGPQPPGDLVDTRHADTVDKGLRVGLLGLGEQDVEAVRRGTGDAIRLARVVADDLTDATGQPVGAPGWRQAQTDHDDARRPPVASHAGVLVAEGDIPVRPGIEWHRPEARRPETGRPGGLSDAAPALRRRTVEEGLDDLTDAVVVLFVGEHEALAAIAARRARRCWRRVVGQLGHGGPPV